MCLTLKQEKKKECWLCNETLQYSQSDPSIINQLYALLANQLLLIFDFWVVQMPVYSDTVTLTVVSDRKVW